MLPGMTTRRQRERQERYRRHGVDRPVAPQREQKAQREGDEGASGTTKKGAKGKAAPRGRKPVPYPTLKRCLIRAPIFGIIWFALITLVLSAGQPPMTNVLQALILTAVMIPLLFVTDMITYRLAKRRDLPVQERPASGYLGFGG